MTSADRPLTSKERWPIRVLVVNASEAERRYLELLIGTDPQLEVAGWASNGQEAIRAAARLRPDVIAMDLQMPVMDGLEATDRIMRETPTPIVMMAGSAARADERLEAGAIRAGVLAVLEKPGEKSRQNKSGPDLLRTLKSMSRVKVVRRWSGKRFGEQSSSRSRGLSSVTTRPRLVVIGASTGGPQALQAILTMLPAGFPLPVLVVQHIAPGFEASMVGWLAPQCALPLHVAEAGISLRTGGIYVAPSGSHLIVRGGELALIDDPLVSGHRPSVTILLKSVVHEYRAAAAGILLSGMGDDGVAGLQDLRTAGGICIAQDEETSIVFGMPGAAIRSGPVDYILSPGQIGALLVRLAMVSPAV